MGIMVGFVKDEKRREEKRREENYWVKIIVL
jgi:hypothetical protein